MLRRLTVALALVGLVGCGGGQAPTQEFGKEDAAAIRKAVSDFVAAYNAQDVEKVASLFSGNAVIMPPNRSMMRGVELVKVYFDGRLKEEGATDLELDELTLDGQGTLAYVLTTYQLKLRPAGGAEERYRGKVIWILRKLGGQWRFEVQMMSGDIPPATPPAAPPAPEKKK
jgi:ketosteroid isomerase-like protein